MIIIIIWNRQVFLIIQLSSQDLNTEELQSIIFYPPRDPITLPTIKLQENGLYFGLSNYMNDNHRDTLFLFYCFDVTLRLRFLLFIDFFNEILHVALFLIRFLKWFPDIKWALSCKRFYWSIKIKIILILVNSLRCNYYWWNDDIFLNNIHHNILRRVFFNFYSWGMLYIWHFQKWLIKIKIINVLYFYWLRLN